MLIPSIGIKKLSVGVLFLVFIVFFVNSMSSGFKKTIVVKNKFEKLKPTKLGKVRGLNLYDLMDENGIRYEISNKMGKNIKIGSVISIKGYKSLFTRQPIISDIL
jgi:hypothetical protein